MAQLLLLASLHEAWGSRGGALGARVPEERLSALLLLPLSGALRGIPDFGAAAQSQDDLI